MKKLKITILILLSLFINGCMSNESSQEEMTHEIAVERMMVSKRETSFQDTLLYVQNILIEENYNIKDIPEILKDTSQVREIITEYDEPKVISDEQLDIKIDVESEIDVVKNKNLKNKNLKHTKYIRLHDHSNINLPPNSLLFPNSKTGYDWQSSDMSLEGIIWVGVQISKEPNKLGNYPYSVYMTSNTFNKDTTISNVVVGGINIKYFSHNKYIEQRSDEIGFLQSKSDFKEQINQEIKESNNKEKLLNDLENFKSPTLIITSNNILVHTFFLPDMESDIIVLWEYIKKID